MYTHIHTRTHTHTHARTHTHMHHMYICINARYTHKYVHTHTGIHTHICINARYTHKYVHAHTGIHTHAPCVHGGCHWVDACCESSQHILSWERLPLRLGWVAGVDGLMERLPQLTHFFVENRQHGMLFVHLFRRVGGAVPIFLHVPDDV